MDPAANIHTVPTAEEAANLYLDESDLRMQTHGDIDVDAYRVDRGMGRPLYHLAIRPEDEGRILNVKLPTAPNTDVSRQPTVTASTITYEDVLEEVYDHMDLHYRVTISTPTVGQTSPDTA